MHLSRIGLPTAVRAPGGALLLSLCLATAGAPRPGPSFAIVSADHPGQTLVFEGSPAREERWLELGDDYTGVLEVRGAGKERVLSADWRFTTSLTLQDEGPHLDLLDWLHHTSEWKPLTRIDSTRFRIRPIVEPLPFPHFARSELLTYVASLGEELATRWGPIAERCDSATSYPCAVGVSEVEVRIFEGEGEARRLLKTLLLKVPLGC